MFLAKDSSLIDRINFFLTIQMQIAESSSVGVLWFDGSDFWVIIVILKPKCRKWGQDCLLGCPSLKKMHVLDTMTISAI